MEPDVPLAVPDVNPEALDGWPRPGIIAVPNCTTVAAVLALAPLHRAATCTSLVLSSYQAVSARRHKAVAELLEQVEKLRGDEESLLHPDVDALPSGPVMGRTIAYNVVPRIGELDQDGFTGEEQQDHEPSRGRSSSAPEHPDVVATSVRVPVIAGHAVSIVAEFARPISPAEARRAPGGGARRRTPRRSGSTTCSRRRWTPPAATAPSSGRIRQVPGRDDALMLFSCADNLRIGAALDAIQIAEQLYPR